MDVGDIKRVELVALTCCEDCDDVYGHNFTCPVCEEHTEANVHRVFIDCDPDSFECENCGAEFKVLGYEGDAATVNVEVECLAGMAKVETRRIDASL